MSKKLLSEAQVRRFQALATIKPIHEMSYKKDDDDKMEETYGDKAHMKDDKMEEMAYKQHDNDDKMEEMSYKKDDDDKMEALYEEEDEMDEADVELDEELVEKFMDAVKTIEEVADVLGGAGAGEDLDMDMGGDEPADDMDMGGDEPAPEKDEDEEEMLEEALRGISYVPSQKEIIKTVAKRVAKRLQEAKYAQAKLNRALGKK